MNYSTNYRNRCLEYWRTHPLPYSKTSTKICASCGETLTLTPDNFYPNRTTKVGIRNICRKCFAGKVSAARAKRKVANKISPETKFCRRCHLEKPSSEFHKDSGFADGLSPDCKPCRAKTAALRYLRDVESIKRDMRAKQAAETPAETELRRSKMREYMRIRMASDPALRLKMNMARRVHYLLMKKRDRGPGDIFGTELILGCSKYDFMARIESMFQPGMSWNNYGPKGWQLHHVLPVKANLPDGTPLFDFINDPKAVRRCFHFLNYRPEWAANNISLSNRLPEDWEKLLAEINHALSN